MVSLPRLNSGDSISTVEAVRSTAVHNGTDTGRACRHNSIMATIRSAAFAAVLTVLFPAAGGTQAVSRTMNTSIPVFRMQVVGDANSGFSTRIESYFELRGRLQRTLPAVAVTDDVRQIRREIRSLANAIRLARPSAIQGEFFTVETSAEFKRVLALIMDADVWAVIMDGNPGAFSHDIDAAYPEGKTRSTMPGVVLATLPGLPADIEFRFLGRHLILYDARANTIIDRLPNAIACESCDE